MKRILILGGNSRLGRSIARQPDFNGTAIARAGHDCIIVADYTGITPSMLKDFDAVLNLTGVTSGSESELFAVNADLAGTLAAKAKQAGVRYFAQISSFSVFGDAAEIDADTQVAPLSAYGRSRVAGEMATAELADNSFSVGLARLPMLYGYGNSKLEKLVRFWLRIRQMPVPAYAIHRSMIHYDLAAQALTAAINCGLDGPLAFADSEAFEYRRAAQALSQGSGKTIDILRLPGLLSSFANWIPSVQKSLYSDSLLVDDANTVVRLKIQSRLYQDLTRMVAEAVT